MTDPRIRQRRIDVAREAGRRRLRYLIAGLVLVTLSAGAVGILHTPLFSAEHITIVGGAGLDRAAVIDASGLSGHPPLVDVDTQTVADRLTAIPQVATASVHEHWPSGVEIVLTQRQPVATAAVGTGVQREWATLDIAGRVLSLQAFQPSRLPVVLLPETPGRPGSYVGGTDRQLVSIAAALPADLAGRVSAVGLDTAGDFVLTLAHGLPVAILGSGAALSQKFVSLETILADVGLSGVSTIDVSVPGAPVLTEIGHGRTVQVINGG